MLGYAWARYIKPLQDGCDAALFVGAHAMAGTPDGILCHTVSSQAWYNARINDTLVGESGIVAAICRRFQRPCVFVSGDEATCREVRALIGDAFVQARRQGRTGPLQRPPSARVRRLRPDRRPRLQRAGRRATGPNLSNSPGRSRFTVELATPDKRTDFVGKPGVEIVNPRLVVSRADTFWQAWDQFWYKS